MHVLPLYAAFLTFLFLGLSFRTLGLRRKLQIAVGDQGNAMMLRAMRVHSNFAEYVPLALILLFLIEFQGAPPIMIHILGSCLFIGRVAHAYGVSQINEQLKFRIFGMILTLNTLGIAAFYLLYLWATRH